jgi:hypothetical protein
VAQEPLDKVMPVPHLLVVTPTGMAVAVAVQEA